MTPVTATPDVLLRVRAGVAWLDANIPDWLGRIDVEGFDIRAECGCIMGQLDGDFWATCGRRHITNETAISLGFLYVDRADASKLNTAWPSEILRLRSERKTP